MEELFSALVVGVLSNLISDGIGSRTKYILSKRDMDLELRRSVENLQNRQVNLEGAIEQLVNNQNLLLSIFLKIIQNYQLKSSALIENRNVIVIPNYEDVDILNKHQTVTNMTDSEKIFYKDKFESYRKYVKEMRREK